ncbi:MAG: hypothetical protein AB7J13_11145 [Pyrinomonadaceae bacterium]
MKTVRTITLSVEKSERLILSGERSTTLFWCDGCGREVKMTGVEKAARAARTSPRSIYRMLESDEIHFRDEESEILICLNSLMAPNLTNR